MNLSAWGPLAVAVACGVGVAWAQLRPPAAEPTVAEVAPTPAAKQLLGGLGPGDKIAGWTVESMSMAAPRQLRLELAAGEVRFAITITPTGQLAESPPLQSKRHAIYYGHVRPEGTRLPRGGLRAILAELKRRIEAGESNAEL